MASYEQKNTQRRRQDDEDGQPQAQPEDQRNEKLDEEVACCLADIDRILEEDGKTEQDTALEEFTAIKNRLRDLAYPQEWDQEAWDEANRDLRIWQATYAHLGLRVGWCCGEPFATDGKTALA